MFFNPRKEGEETNNNKLWNGKESARKAKITAREKKFLVKEIENFLIEQNKKKEKKKNTSFFLSRQQFNNEKDSSLT